MRKTWILWAALLALTLSCGKKEYDISEGYNKEIGLFRDDITVPVGSIGPITIGSTLSGVSKIPGLGGMLSQILKEGSDGSLMVENSGNIFKINVYELEGKMKDPNAAEVWNAGYQSGYIGGIVSMLGMLGLKATHQKLSVSVTNPLSAEVPVTSTAVYNYNKEDGTSESTPIPELQSFTMDYTSGAVEKLALEVPETVPSPVSSVSLSDLSLSIPAKPSSKIIDKTGNLFFSFDYKYTAGIAVGSTFSLPLKDFSPGKVSLPIGKYKAKFAEVHVEIVNTIPLSVKVDNVRVIIPKQAEGEEDKVDTNIKIDTGGALVRGGSPEHPATSSLTLSIEALEGTIPDINGIKLDIEAKAEPSLGLVPLTTSQSVFVKSATAHLRGGVTIPFERK